MRFFLLLVAMSLPSLVLADMRSMGADYRRLLSNYQMLLAITRKCPELELPDVEPKARVEQMMQNKIGIDAFLKLMIQIQKSSLRQDAIDTVDKLWEKLDGCEDPRLERTLERIASVHADTFARFEKAPPLVAPKPVPVPLRQQ